MKSLIATILFTLLLLAEVHAVKYNVRLERANGQKPLCNNQDNRSIFSFNYNPSFLEIRHNGVKVGEGLLVRSQNSTKAPYDVGPSVFTLARSTSPSGMFDDPNNITVSRIDLASLVFEQQGKAESYGVEDPRIVYRQKDHTYYMFYTAAEQNGTEVYARLVLATTKTPEKKNSWKRLGPVVPDFKWSKSGALLLRDEYNGPHFLIWGDDVLRIAVSTNLREFKTAPSLFLKTRADHFDSHLVESGPPPLKLSDGNYLFIYNSARRGFPSPRPGYDLQYNAGWVILDGKAPQRILQRCELPLISPELAWEKGDKPYLGLVPNVVFVEAAKSLGGDRFLVFYGAADSVIGSAVITVTKEVDSE